MFQKIYKWAADALFAKILPGKKTLILSWICKIWGAADIAVHEIPSLAIWLCDTVHVCVQGSTFYGTLLSVLGVLFSIFRQAAAIYPEIQPTVFKKPDPDIVKS